MDMGGDRSPIRRGLRVALKAFSSATEFTSLLDKKVTLGDEREKQVMVCVGELVMVVMMCVGWSW